MAVPQSSSESSSPRRTLSKLARTLSIASIRSITSRLTSAGYASTVRRIARTCRAAARVVPSASTSISECFSSASLSARSLEANGVVGFGWPDTPKSVAASTSESLITAIRISSDGYSAPRRGICSPFALSSLAAMTTDPAIIQRIAAISSPYARHRASDAGAMPITSCDATMLNCLMMRWSSSRASAAAIVSPFRGRCASRRSFGTKWRDRLMRVIREPYGNDSEREHDDYGAGFCAAKSATAAAAALSIVVAMLRTSSGVASRIAPSSSSSPVSYTPARSCRHFSAK